MPNKFPSFNSTNVSALQDNVGCHSNHIQHSIVVEFIDSLNHPELNDLYERIDAIHCKHGDERQQNWISTPSYVPNEDEYIMMQNETEVSRYMYANPGHYLTPPARRDGVLRNTPTKQTLHQGN